MFKVQKSLSDANLPRTIRFTEELFKELSDTAVKNRVSFNALVLQCCRYALDNLKCEDKE